MVFTQSRGFVVGASYCLQCRSLRCRVLACNVADTASLATCILFGKLLLLRSLLAPERSGVVKTFRYVSLDLRFVNIPSNDADNLQESFDSPKEYHVAANVRGSNAIAEFRTHVAHIRMLGYQTTFIAQLLHPLSGGYRFVACDESSDLLEVFFRFRRIPESRHVFSFLAVRLRPYQSPLRPH